MNRAVFASYCEQARTGFLRDRVGRATADPDTVLARLELDCERSIEADDEVTVAVAVAGLVETSFALRYEGRPRALPEAWRDALAPRPRAPTTDRPRTRGF